MLFYVKYYPDFRMKFDTFQRRFAEKVKSLRKEKGITQEGMEDHVEGLSYRTMQQIEENKANPTMKTLFNLSRALGVKVKDLLDLED